MIKFWDEQIFFFLNSLAGQNRILDYLIIFLAEYFGYFLIAAFLFLIFWKYKKDAWRPLIFAVFSLLLSASLTQIIRYFYYRPRPFLTDSVTALIDHSSTSSLPSGHSVFFFALAFVVFYLNRRWSWWFLGGAFLMGLARIFAGVHWPLDIIGGAILGFLSVFIIITLFTFRNTKGSDKLEPFISKTP